MNTLLKSGLLAALCLVSSLSSAQKQVHNQSQAWLGYFNQTRLSDKWGLWLDVHARRTDFLDRWSAQLIRPGVTYFVKDNVRLTVGYTYARSFPAAGLHTVRPEHRLWQQILWTSRQKRLQTQQWIRLEERFNRKIAADELQEGYQFNYRFRYLLNLMVPLNHAFLDPKTLFFVFNDEVHLNAGKEITYNVFDQNRFFVGLGYQFNKELNLQVGYMNQFQQLPAGNQFNSNHVLRVFLFHQLDFRPKQEKAP
ncbi:DUF2490 domain-containing protein [Siphonobacter aquaeclarae]|uniref:DUF2490 domain-containing protein n=1 Tax=Siphonobacter aquaeclarae TaxID=563176 RepID=A0A1G9JZJ2_9BACT|nr:DUF2490 domain-containing protein [Siphonobacter aquaeclarae]SDL42832.1 Protein of unknown function [Siphonobacter aquaeclarae]